MDQRLNQADLDKIDFFSPDILANPYDLLARLRKERPVAKFRQAGFDRDQYVVTTHALVSEVFQDQERFSSNYREILIGDGNDEPEVAAIMAQAWAEVDSLMTADEPDHTRLRALAAKGFTPSRVKRMSGLIADVINNLIDGFIARGECDFVREFAALLPIHSIGAVLGISPTTYGKLYDWSFARIRRNGQMGTLEERISDARQLVEMKHFIADLVSDRRKSPKDDLVSDLVTAQVDGQSPFSEMELYSTVLMLIVGGAESSRSTLISIMARLLQNPDRLALVLADMSLVPKVTEEVLRLDGPGAAIWRIATRDTELGGVKIPKGGVVMLRMDSASRDETVYRNPEAFDPQRDNNQHFAFGMGIHYCIGVRLAREQVNQSIHALLTRLKDVRMIADKSDLRVHPSVFMKCFRELYLAFTPGRPVVHRAA